MIKQTIPRIAIIIAYTMYRPHPIDDIFSTTTLKLIASVKNDTAKTNVKQLLKQLSPETEMKVI